MNTLLWGVLLRMLQTLAQAAPTILTGLLTAAVLQQLLGATRTRTLFGVGTWRSLPQAWLLGMLLPVCALGVIPVARVMRRSGIGAGAVLGFALTAPLFNPLSLLYGLTLSDPLAIFTFALCSLILVTAVGMAFEWLVPHTEGPAADAKPIPVGWRRMASLLLFAMRESVPTMGYVGIALLGVAMLAAILPAGSLQQSMEHDNVLAPASMAVLALPAYATPMLAMSQVGMMFGHANSIGAAFVLLVLGTGINLGLMAWAVRNYGWRIASAWLVIVVAVVVLLGYAVNEPLHPRDIEPAGHTHAFDIYCAPMHAGESQPARFVLQQLRESFTLTDKLSLSLLFACCAGGALLLRFDRDSHCEAWLQRTPPKSDVARQYDFDIPGPIVAGVALCGLMVFSVVGCFYYYPAPQQAFAEMTIVNTELASGAISGNREHAEFFLPLAEDWARRMQVGVYLRRGQLTRFQQIKARIYGEKLELLEHALADDSSEEVKEHAHEVSQAFHRLKAAFLPVH